ncbi:hypothetical protein Q0F99_11900 [Rathayibacter oskolensis]|uniref:hypothetical protein n=1 Tax=Rathayibacter oskolensis TaxID=1891671 RepID=UPI00265EEC74|nr:hypothetical protein [Rathayibacter oskolensis]WKK73418.1 hypothetical protein Q0F99_11900 [Rathayibacter oskolensis]
MPDFRLLEPRLSAGARLEELAAAAGLTLGGRGDVVVTSVTVSHREVRAGRSSPRSPAAGRTAPSSPGGPPRRVPSPC